jgi:RNA polymerase primary sigma factor
MKSLRITSRFTNIQSESFKKYLSEISEISAFTPDEELECSIKAANGDRKAINELIKRNLRFVVSVAKQYETSNVLLEDLVNEGNIGLITAAEKYNPTKGFKFITYAVFWIRKIILEYLVNNSRLVRLPSNKVNGLSKYNQYVTELEQKLGKNVDVLEVIEEYGSKMPEDEIFELQNLSLITFDSLNATVGEKDNNLTLCDTIPDDSFQPTDHLVTNQDVKLEINDVLNHLKPRDRDVMISLFGLNGTTPLTLKEVGEQIGLTREMVRQIRKKSLDKLKKCGVY